eukprot:474648-Rhodomonas_salina.3
MVRAPLAARFRALHSHSSRGSGCDGTQSGRLMERGGENSTVSGTTPEFEQSSESQRVSLFAKGRLDQFLGLRVAKPNTSAAQAAGEMPVDQHSSSERSVASHSKMHCSSDVSKSVKSEGFWHSDHTHRKGRMPALLFTIAAVLLSIDCVSSAPTEHTPQVLLSVPMPRRQLLFNPILPQPPEPAANSTSCERETIVIGKNPQAWFYAAGDDGLPQHGLPWPALVTAGSSDRTYAFQWQGVCVCVCVFMYVWITVSLHQLS